MSFNVAMQDLDDLVKLEYNPQVLYDILEAMRQKIRELELKVEALENKE